MKSKIFPTIAAGFMVAALGYAKHIPENSSDTFALTFDIESKYAASGPFTATSVDVSGYRIFYPSQMDGNHPIITWGNGTAAPTWCYTILLKHLASWGFVVVASNSTMTGSGKEMLAGIDYLIAQNGTQGSVFYAKLDTSKIGASGHSQGGGGAINTAKDSRVTCSAPLAPSPGNTAQVRGPMFLVAGAKDTACTPKQIRANCYVPAKVPVVFATNKNMNHFQFGWDCAGARGYITAWFMFQLKGDQLASDAFIGAGEILGNDNWTAEKKGL